ncbi:hypothetical protein GY15_08575 [Delftia sp. 670]|nr:hypothetical protein GY15_08575 [Delftia sp. 670]
MSRALSSVMPGGICTCSQMEPSSRYGRKSRPMVPASTPSASSEAATAPASQRTRPTATPRKRS